MCAQILIVDDEVVNIMALEMMLRRFNFNTDSALNGLQCLDRMRQKRGSWCCEWKAINVSAAGQAST